LIRSIKSATSTWSCCFHPSTRWGCWRRHMMPHTKLRVHHILVSSPSIPWRVLPSLPLSPFSLHRFGKKHLTASLVSSRTSYHVPMKAPGSVPSVLVLLFPVRPSSCCLFVQKNIIIRLKVNKTRKHRSREREVVVEMSI